MICVSDVTKRFLSENGSEKTVLQDVNLQVQKGEFMCLLGPSGCGKSTLLRLIGGLDTPTKGTIEIAGQKLEGPWKKGAFVFQNYGLFPWKTVLGNVEFGMKINQMYPKAECRKRAEKYLNKVGLTGYEKHFIHQLSGGMRQRVAIARALAMEPEILFMDEPFGALDTFTRMSLQDLLLAICRERKMTVLSVTKKGKKQAAKSKQ